MKQPAPSESLQRLLEPRSVALVGVSGDESQNSARPLRFMRLHGFGGRVFPVNSARPQVLGEQAWPSVSALPEVPDLALVMVAGARVPVVLEDCARAGVRFVIVYAGGFADGGEEGRRRQQELVEQARSLGLRILGPNSIGLANIHTGAIVSVNASFEAAAVPKGGISFVSQSGSMMGSLLSRAAARGFGFAKSVSVGNEADISVGEVVDALVDDDDTRVILLFLEALREGKDLGRALLRAQLAGKPVVAYKLGQSDAANLITVSHTGALAGERLAVDAFFRRHGVIRVSLLESLFEIAPLAQRHPTAPADRLQERRVAIVTTTGGGAAVVVDNLALRGLVPACPQPATIEHLRRRGVTISGSPIIDLTLAATSAQYRDVLVHLLESDWCDAVLSVVGSSAQFHPQLAVRPLLEAGRRASKPLVAFLTPEAPDSLRTLQANGIAAFRTPEACADALAAFLDRSRARGACSDAPHAPSWPARLPTRGVLSEPEAAAVFSGLGIPVARHALLQGDDMAHSLSYPLVAKISSREIPHKTEVDGVRLGIRNEAELRDAVAALLDNARIRAPQASIEGILVQQQEHGLVELILGYRLDPVVGPMVILGAGGTVAEINHDSCVRMAPVNTEEAHEMIREVRVTKLIRGFRGLPMGDLDALAKAIVDMSRLSLLEGVTVSEAEINPLLVQPTGVVAVDALLRLDTVRLDTPTNPSHP